MNHSDQQEPSVQASPMPGDLPTSATASLPKDPGSVRRLGQIFSRDPVQWFMFSAFILVGYVFYSTDFRDVLEDWFFDVRATMENHRNQIDDVMIVGIDDEAIEALDATRIRLQSDAKRRTFLSIESLTSIAGLLANSDARLIALLMPHFAFPHSDEKLRALTEIIQFDQRMFVGTTEYNRSYPGVGQLPYPLGAIRDRVFGYETFRRRSNMILRKLPRLGYRGLTEELMLPVAMSYLMSGKFGDLASSYTLNPLTPTQIPTVSASMAVSNPRGLIDLIKGKIVILGYTTFRDIPFQTTEMMNVNTPLIGEVQSVEKGAPVTFLVANAVENLVHNRNILPLNPVFNLLQTIIVAAISGILWELGSFIACTMSLLLWFLLLFAHAQIMSKLNVMIPLSDTFIISAFVMIFAAVRRLRDELKDMAERHVQTESKQEIAKMQSHFLTEFATWLRDVTSIIVSDIRKTQTLSRATPQSADIYHRAFSAGEDFNGYLESIRQIPELESSTRRLLKKDIDISSICMKIVRRFEIKTQEKGINIIVEANNIKPIKSNSSLLDAIIFNLISNAIKYSPQGSSVYITVRQLAGKGTILTIKDEGPGIPDELKERIFEKFYRIQDDRIYTAKGTGLGLYLCRFFAGKLGGQVSVHDNSPKGSVFVVTLP
jgi:signal transduction histidine kinase